jgi:hypothetical protein
MVNQTDGVVGFIILHWDCIKIIHLIPKIAWPWKFYKNNPKLFRNYILVPIISHIGPCLTFYNYIYVLFLINMLILITYLIY